MITPEKTVLYAMLICFGGALVTLLLGRARTLAGWVAFVVIAASSALVLSGVSQVLVAGAGKPMTFLAWPAFGFSLRIYVDGLSAVFLGLIAVISVPVTLYSLEYMRHHSQGGVGRYYPNFLLFVPAMYGLVSTTDMMWFFFIFWQMMTWSGWALIRYERRHPQHAWAANKYLWMMQLACVLTMLGTAMLAKGPAPGARGETLMAYDFDAVSRHLPAMLETNSAWVVMACTLFLLGFGIKLGMWPFGQIWLPDAHPAAPSPVSALLSGVMIKTGIYGVMRYFLWLVPAEARGKFPLETWGLVIGVLGVLTLFTGTVQALKQEQSKRLLAFSSIGQAGYILFGLGVCMALLPSANPAVAALGAVAFYGALFHTVNHGVFKSLLFLNAGSVLDATGTQDMNKIGGLMRFMPLTAMTALVASFAISGVPLFSGFASKWCLFVAAIQGSPAAHWLPIGAMIAILTSALTLALFIKFFGTIFLSRTSALVAERSRRRPSLEVGWKMRLPQAALAGLAMVCGLLPVLPLSAIQQALEASRQGFGELLAESAPGSLTAALGLGSFNAQSVYAPLLLAVMLGVLFALVRLLAKLGGARRRAAAPWLCGYAREAEMHRYRAGHLYGELKKFLEWLGSAAQPPAAPDPEPEKSKTKEQLAWSLEKN